MDCYTWKFNFFFVVSVCLLSLIILHTVNSGYQSHISWSTWQDKAHSFIFFMKCSVWGCSGRSCISWGLDPHGKGHVWCWLFLHDVAKHLVPIKSRGCWRKMLYHFHYAHHANLISCSLVLGNHMPPYSMFQQWGYGRCIKCYGSQVFTFYVSILRESYFQPEPGNISVFFLLLRYKKEMDQV